MKTIQEAQLDVVTQRLINEFQPERIILFGSHAWGTPNEDSDLDLLVIVPQSSERPTRRATRAYRCLRGLTIPAEIMVKTRAEVERYQTVRASLESEILERGKVLHG